MPASGNCPQYRNIRNEQRNASPHTCIGGIVFLTQRGGSQWIQQAIPRHASACAPRRTTEAHSASNCLDVRAHHIARDDGGSHLWHTRMTTIVTCHLGCRGCSLPAWLGLAFGFRLMRLLGQNLGMFPHSLIIELCLLDLDELLRGNRQT